MTEIIQNYIELCRLEENNSEIIEKHPEIEKSIMNKVKKMERKIRKENPDINLNNLLWDELGDIDA